MLSYFRALSRTTALTLAAAALLLSATAGTVLASSTFVAPVLVPYTVNVIAGNSQTTVPGYGGEGVPGTSATLSAPSTVAVDSVGNVYISDRANALIREVNAQTGIIKTIAGQPPTKCTGTVCTQVNSGCSDGVPALGSQVGSNVQGLVVDGFGNVYFSDYNYQGVWVIYHGGAQVSAFIQLVDAAGVTTAGGVKAGYVYHIAGIAAPKAGGGCTDSSGNADQVLATQGSFHDPLQMGIDAAGNLYIQDYANDVVRVINTQSTAQTFFGGPSIKGVTVQPGFVAAVVLCSAKLTTVCPQNAAPFGGPANQALFSTALQGMTADQYGNVYQLDGKGTPNVQFAGAAYAGGAALAHLINVEYPSLTATPGGWYEVIDNITNTSPLPSGAPQAVYANNTPNVAIRGSAIGVDPLGNLYMMDNHWASVFRVDVNSGMVTRMNNTSAIVGTLAAPVYCSGTSGPQSYDAYGDGCGISQAKLNGAGTGYVTFDGAGNLYIADLGNNTVRKVSVGNRFPATAVGTPVTQTLQLHFDASNLPAAAYPFKIVSASTDFTINGTPTCANYTLNLDASTECYVNVTFAPTAPGARAATLQATTGNGSVYPFSLSGFANGPQIAIDGGTPTSISLPKSAAGTATSPTAIAFDAVGNTYIADSANSRVVELPAGGGAAITVAATGLSNPQGVAVDPQGNVYISDTGNQRVVEISATTQAQTVLATNLNGPVGLTLDPLGNLYVADVHQIVEISPFGELAPSAVATGSISLTDAVGVASDRQGNIYVADAGSPNGLNGAGAIIEIAAGGGDFQASGTSIAPPAKVVSLGTANIASPGGIAIDAAGNLYISDSRNAVVQEIPSATGPGSEPFALNFAVNQPTALALDSYGNLYVVDPSKAQVLVDTRSTLALNFGTTYIHQTPGTIPLTVTNIGSTPYTPTQPFSTITGANPGDFTETDTCGPSNFPLGTIAPGLHCALTPTYNPTLTGTETASITVQNGAALISLTGTGNLAQAVLNLQFGSNSGTVAGQTATVVLTATQPTNAAITPHGGQVTFSYTVNGVLTTLPPVTLPPSGILAFNLPTLLLGRTYVVNASYSGDPGNSAATASPLFLSVPGLPVTVTANSLTYVYGGTVPQPTGTVTGILPADQANVKYTFSTAATPSSPVGSYPIIVTFSGGNYQNYGFPQVYNPNSLTPAVVTETQAALNVAVNNANASYGATNLTYTVTPTGLVNGDQLAITYTPAKSQYLNVGTYTIVPTITSLTNGPGTYDKINNYKLTTVNGTLIVTQTNSAVAVVQPLKAVLPTALATAAITFTAKPAMPGYGTPTGTLTLQDVFTPFTSTGTGPTITEPNVVLPLVMGVATYTPTDPTIGTHVYTVAYSGDANFIASSTSSAPNTLVVDLADFTIVSTTSPVQVAPGVTPGGGTTGNQQAATPETANVFISPVLGSTQVVSLTCASPVSYLTCTIAPNSITLNGTSSQTAVLSLSTPQTLPLGFTGALRRQSRGFDLAFIPLALLTMLPICSAKRRRLRATRLLALVAGVVLLAGLNGCGGNSVA